MKRVQAHDGTTIPSRNLSPGTSVQSVQQEVAGYVKEIEEADTYEKMLAAEDKINKLLGK